MSCWEALHFWVGEHLVVRVFLETKIQRHAEFLLESYWPCVYGLWYINY
jgi:hypothetical protein